MNSVLDSLQTTQTLPQAFLKLSLDFRDEHTESFYLIPCSSNLMKRTFWIHPLIGFLEAAHNWYICWQHGVHDAQGEDYNWFSDLIQHLDHQEVC